MTFQKYNLLFVLFALMVAVPQAAAQRDFDGVEIETTELGHGVYMLTGAGGNLGLSVGQDGVFLIDDQYAPLSEKILKAIGNLTEKPVDFVFNTHYHGDHTGGNENLGQTGSHLVSHTNVRRRLSHDQYSPLLDRVTEASGPGFLPTITFTDSLTFHFNEQKIVAFHAPHAHTDGDGVLHLPEANIIHAGDVVFFGLYPYIDTGAGGSIDGMIAAVDRIIDLCDDKTQIIPGHGPLLNKTQLEEYLDMLTRARANVAAAVAKAGDLKAVQEAKPCAEWDDSLGQVWLTSDQFVQSIYDSLEAGEGHHGHHHH